ncbi:putative Sodium:sulfate symporter [Escherichia coli]|nr:putative Sodium:sulfate symporter [Escherichia coli]
MQFTFNEGHIQLPSQWQDQSMQVLVSTDNSGINLVITREAVPQGTLTPELYQETLALYQGKLDGGNDSNLLIVFYVQIMPDDFVMQLHRF